MLQGVLTGGSAGEDLATVLGRLAQGAETGCLRVEDPAGATARVHLRDGRLWAAEVPGARVPLGTRLVADGVLTADALAEAELAQREELQGWRLGELLVHLGALDAAAAARHVQQRRVEALHDLLTWQEGSWRFRRGERTRGDVAPPADLPALLAAAPATPTTCRADDLPVLSAADVPADSLALDPAAFSLLCHVDGSRTAGALARALGVPLAEVARALGALVAGGLVEVRPASAGPDDEPDDDGPAADGFGALARDLSALLGRGPADRAPGHEPFAVGAPQEPFPVGAPDELAAPPAPAPEEPFLAPAPEEPFLVEAPEEPFPAWPDPPTPAEPFLVGAPEEPFAVAQEPAAPTDPYLAEPAPTAAGAPAADVPEELFLPDDPSPAAATPEGPAEPAAVPAPRDGLADGFFAAAPAGGGTDTASLLRELSSLGLQDDPPPPPRTAPRPAPAAPKRRKGLFGR